MRECDAGFERDSRFTERVGFQFRTVITNLFNMVSLNAPNATLSSSSVGKITAAAPARIIQLGGRIVF
jgi:hypothetical protein